MTFVGEVTADAPTIWLKLNEASGGAVDSGSAALGTIAWSATPAAYRVVGGTLNDTPNYAVTLPAANALGLPARAYATTLTVELLWKPSTIGTGTQQIINRDITNGHRFFRLMANTNGSLTLFVFNTSEALLGADSAAGVLTNGAWHHIVFTIAYNGTNTTAKIYVNGLQVATNSIAGAMRTISDQLFLSHFASFTGNTFARGDVQHLAIYDGVALSAARISAHAAATAAPALTTVAPGGIASSEAWGTPTVTRRSTVGPAGIASSEAWGTPTVAPGPVSIAPGGIASSEAWGVPTVVTGLIIAGAGGIASPEAWGAVVVTPGGVSVAPGGIASSEAWGTPGVAAPTEPTPAPGSGLLAGGGKFEIAVTTHHDLETSTPAHAVAWLHNFTDAEVTIGQNDSREARVTLSLWDSVVALFDSGRNDYLYRLFIRYHGVPAIWAPVKTEWNAAAGTVTLIARDTDRLEAHYLRDGDAATGVAITADHIGLRTLRDAANNTVEQDARFVAPLGIEDGTNTADSSTATVTFEKGEEVFASMQQLAAATGAPDFEHEPYDLADAAGVAYGWYMKLNTYAAQGVDRTSGADAVVFHCGYGLNNLADMRAVPDQFITHAHALGDGGDPRATAYHATSSRQRGVYVHWAATQFQDFAALALPAVAEMWVRSYGLPTHQWTIDLKPDALQQWVALAGYGIGDKIIAGVKRGYMIREEPFRIRALRLKQADRLNQTTAEVTVEPPLVNPVDIGTTETS